MTKNSLFFNGCFDKNRIKSLISWSLKNCGEKITIDLVENLKTLGFAYATEAGISLGIDDLKIPPTKAKFISEADVKIKLTQINYKQGYLTGIEKFQQLIDTWHRTSEILKQNVIQYFRSTDILNPVYMMAFSGARGNISQVRQLVGMRGLMSDPQGQILDFPIKSNFREGLTLTEYIISCYGARKGLVDTALKTANSGYLTRRLVDVSHHIIISDFDCKTQRGIVLNTITENQKVIVPLQKRLIGRILAENIYSKNQTTRQVISQLFLENLSTANITTKISNVSTWGLIEPHLKWGEVLSNPKIKQKLAFTNPLLNTNSLQSEIWFPTWDEVLPNPTKKISNLGYINLDQRNNNGRTLALFFQLIVYDLSKKWSLGLHKNKDTNKNNFYELWDMNKSTEEILVAEKEKDFYWQQLVFFLNHVILTFSNKTLIASKNEEISVSLAEKIATLKKQVLVRSPLTCEIKNSLCQLCYGWSLAHGKLVSLGEAVGIIAAQSIGEPGTQLTMRTFHTGGVFSGDIMSEIRASFSGRVEFPEFFQGVLIRTPHGKIAFLTKVPGNFQIISKENLQFNLPEKNKLSNIGFDITSPQVGIDKKYHENKIKTIKNVTFEIPAFTVLFVRNQEHVVKTQLIAEFSSISANRNQRIQANHDLNAELEGEVYFKNVIVHTQTKKEEILNRTTYNLGSIWIFSGNIYQQPVSFTLFPQPGDLVNINSVMGQYSSMSPYNGVLNVFPDASNKISCKATNALKNISFIFNETNELSKYLKTEQNEKFIPSNLLNKKKQKSYNTLQNKKIKINTLSTNTPFLNHTLISFAIKYIQYKKIGYFLSFLNAQKSLISLDRFFLSNSLKQKFKNPTKLKTNFYFQSFPKQYQTETGGILICDNFYINEKLGSGEVFWISEETYTFSSCNFVCFHFKPKVSVFHKNKNKNYFFPVPSIASVASVALQRKGQRKEFGSNEVTLQVTSLPKGTSPQVTQHKEKLKKQTNYKKWINKNNSLVFYHNSQGKISSFSSKLNGFIQSDLNSVLFNNEKTPSGAPVSSQPKVQTQQKKCQLSLVAKKKESKIQNTFFAYKFFDDQNFYKKRFGSQISSKLNLENKKANSLNFRLNPISFYNAKHKKLYFALFKTTRSCIVKPKFAWGNNKKQCKLRTKSKYSKHYFSNISPNKLNKNTTLINLLKIKSFNSQTNKHKDSKLLLWNTKLTNCETVCQPEHYVFPGSVHPHPHHKWVNAKENRSNLSYFGNNLSKTSQNFFQRKNLFILNKKNKFKLKIKPGWVYFPTNIKQIIFKQKSVIQPGVICFDDILFDQYSVYFEYFSFNKFYNKNLSQTDSLQFQTKVEKNTNLKYTLNFQFICNKFNLSKNNKVFSNAILTKTNKYFFFASVHSSKFLSKNFSAFILSTRKKTLRNKKLLLNNFIKKNIFQAVFKKDKKENYSYDKIYFLQTFSFSKKRDINILNNGVLPILIPLKNIFCFQLLIKQISESNEKQFTRIKTKFIPKFFVLLRKINSYSFISSVKYKALLSQQNQKGLHLLITQNNNIRCFATQSKTKIHFISFSWFNQQKITQLFFNSLSPDFSIKPYFPYKGYRKYVFLKNTIILKFFILFVIPKHYAFNIVQIKFISKTENNKLQHHSSKFPYTANSRFKKNQTFFALPFALPKKTSKAYFQGTFALQSNGSNGSKGKNIDFLISQRNKLIFNLTSYLNFSILQELKFSNQLRSNNLNTKLEKNILLFYLKNAISLQTPISLTTFFSPFQGEILKPQAESIEKLNENFLILTDKDQVTFSLNSFPLCLSKQGEKEIIKFDKSTQIIKGSNDKKIVVANLKPPSPNFLGNFIGYGTKILENLAIPESGQIIQINKSKIVVRKVQSILFSRKGILSVYNGGIIEKNSLVLSLFYQRLKTGDIVQGIPKIEQLFEARKTNQGEILAGSLHEKLESIFKYYKKKYNPEIAASFSLTKIQQIIVNNVQQVYQSQGVTIAEKHLEIIVRQMTSKVQIIKSGETNLLRGEIVDLDWIKMINKGIRVEKAQYKPVILGITKKSLETKSFISEASFQETTRILAKAAMQRKTDFLKGLKENVILGHVIPAGTGFSFSSGKILNTNKLKFFHTNKISSFDTFGDIFSKIST